MSKIVEIIDLHKSYLDGDNRIHVLQGINLEIKAGDFLSIQGASGTGKSTFLNVIGALDKFDEGDVVINGESLKARKPSQLNNFRKKHLGFIFQYHYLLPEFTVIENAMMPLLLLKQPRAEAREQAKKILEKVGLGHRLDHYPAQISGGESQRVAVARAMVHNPPLILADEPTGNLDGANTENFINLLNELIEENNLTVLLVTHADDLAKTARRQMVMKAGLLSEVSNLD